MLTYIYRYGQMWTHINTYEHIWTHISSVFVCLFKPAVFVRHETWVPSVLWTVSPRRTFLRFWIHFRKLTFNLRCVCLGGHRVGPPPPGHDHHRTNRRAAGRLPALQSDHDHDQRQEADELWRWDSVLYVIVSPHVQRIWKMFTSADPKLFGVKVVFLWAVWLSGVL